MAGSFGNGRTTGGIGGSGGKNVAPIYKPLQGGRMGPAPVQGPQLPKKKKPSVVSKVKKKFRQIDEALFPNDSLY